MTRTLTVLAAQTRPVAFDAAATFDKFEQEARMLTSAFPNAEVLLFPELYLTGEDPFTPGPARYEEQVAETVPGPLTDRVAKVAERVGRHIVAGSIFERDGDDIFNTALVASPDGAIVATYRKLFPWRPWETVTPGDRIVTFDVPAGRVGLMICYDGWFPEVPRSLALAGAEVIVQPSLTSTPDRAEEVVLARAHAISNQCYVVNTNAASTIGGGRSVAVDPEGRVLFEAGQGEEFLLEVLDLDRVATVREQGTRGLNRVWDHFRDAPPAATEAYRT